MIARYGVDNVLQVAGDVGSSEPFGHQGIQVDPFLSSSRQIVCVGGRGCVKAGGICGIGPEVSTLGNGSDMERGGSQRIGGGVAKGNEFAINGGGVCGDGITRDKWQGTEIDVSGIRSNGSSEVTGADGIGISADGEVYLA